ncbi:hypothetical protein Tco_0899759 [Tanacetum coccineum]
MGCCGKLMMRVGPLILSLDGKLLGLRRMTKKINVHPEWKILQTLTNGAKRKLDHLLLHLVNGLLWKTNDESGTPRSQSGWKTSWAKKDDKEDQCASRVEDSSNTNQWGKKEAGSSPPSSGKWAAKRKLMMRVGPLVLSLDGKLLGPRRMTKKINVHPEWKILQTLTNGAKRKLDHLLLHLSGWKTSWAKKDDKEDQCASRVEDSSNTNQWGKKEAGSSPPSSGKWAAKRKLMMRVGPLVLSLDGKLLGPRRMTKKINVHPEWKILQTLTNGAKRKLDHLLLHLMDLSAFIHVMDLTEVKVAERERAEGEAKLLDSTVGRVVPLLPVALARAKSELEASVEKLFDEGGSTEQGDSATGGGNDAEIELVTGVENIAAENVIAERPKHPHKKRPAVMDACGSFHPPKKLIGDYGTSSGAATGSKSLSILKDLLASSILNVEVGVMVVAILPLVISSVSATQERESGVLLGIKELLQNNAAEGLNTATSNS